jgi:hypothetical protein
MYQLRFPKFALKIGDELKMLVGAVTHVMTVVALLGGGDYLVLDAPKNGTACFKRLSELLASGQTIRLGRRGHDGWQEQQAVWQRANEVLGSPNLLLRWNCEHISSYVRTGKAESPQLRGFFAVVIGTAALFAIAN